MWTEHTALNSTLADDLSRQSDRSYCVLCLTKIKPHSVESPLGLTVTTFTYQYKHWFILWNSRKEIFIS